MCPKPRNHETTKPWNLSDLMSQRWSWQNHETTKPQNLSDLMSQRWSWRNHETTQPWNLSAFDVLEMEWAKPQNRETTKSIVIWFEDIFLPRQHINDIYVIRTVQVLHFFANDWLTVEYLYRFNVLIFFKWEDNTAYNFIFLQIVANLVGIFKQIIFGQVVKVNIEWKRSLRGKNKVKHPAQIGCVKKSKADRTESCPNWQNQPFNPSPYQTCNTLLCVTEDKTIAHLRFQDLPDFHTFKTRVEKRR